MCNRFSRAVSVTIHAAVVIVITLALPAGAAGQTAGTVSVGVALTQVNPQSEELGRSLGIGPLVRLNPRHGWGVDVALNWFSVDVTPAAPGMAGGVLTVRPVMVGASYTVGPPSTLVSLSIVAGPSLDTLEFHDRDGDTVEVGLVTRPGITITHALARRVGLVGFAGYLVHRRGALFVDGSTTQRNSAWNANAVVLSVAAVYSLF